MRARKIEYYTEIADNYMNGNISDFKAQLKKCSKRDVLILTEILSEYFEPVNVSKALRIVSKYLDID